MPAAVRLHVPAHMLPDGPEDLPTFYRNLLQGLQDMGARAEVLHRDMESLRRGQRGADFDFIHNGNVDRPQVLNLGPAYLGRFFYADPKGIFFDSSLLTAPFNPHAMPADKAAQFADTLRKLFVTPRKSRHSQPEAPQDFGHGHIAVFLQDLSDPVIRSRHMTARQMVQAVIAGAGARRVVVKPHPRNMGEETQEICAWLAAAHPQVTVTQANVHDILAGAAVTVSIGSSVAMEGMLHGVPAVLCGWSDLHHCAVTADHPDKVAGAIAEATGRDWPFEAFLFWFLRRNCIWATRPFMDRILERMARQGADFAALGIRRPTQPEV